MFLIDEGFPYDVSHPFHLHGNDFYVVAMERHVRNPDNIGAKGGEGRDIICYIIKYSYYGIIPLGCFLSSLMSIFL